MNIKIGSYQITSDSLQFIVNKIGIVQEGVKTKAENVGNETLKPIAYCTNFSQALRYIPQDILKTNDDMNIIMDKLNAMQEDIESIKEYPVIFIKEEKETKDNEISINKNYYDQLLQYGRKLEILENYGVDNWGGYGDAMAELEEEPKVKIVSDEEMEELENE